MRNLTFAVSGNTRLGANVLAMLHEMGHSVETDETQSGPLRDITEALGLGENPAVLDADGRSIDWLIGCDASIDLRKQRLSGVDQPKILAFSASSATFPPRLIRVEWQTIDPDGTVRRASSRDIELASNLCGADMVAEVETAAEELFVEIVSLLGRDAFNDDAMTVLSGNILDDGTFAVDLAKLAGWHASNLTDRHFDLDASLPEMVFSAAQANPQAVALHDEDGTIDYATFVSAAKKLAQQLSAGFTASSTVAYDDAGAPRVIAVRLRKSSLLYVAILGAIGSGAAYLPLDPSFPMERVRVILEQAHAECLITDEAFDSSALSDLPIRVVPLTRNVFESSILDDSAWPLEDDPERASRCAITIFTSGSTGVPKGVMLTHRNIVHFCHWYREYAELTAASRVLQFCTVAFDVSLLDIFPTFLAGATLVVPTEEQRHALDDLSQLIELLDLRL
ncbi:AMP-binding protein [Caballeronia sp. GAWG1-1]|uniref:AMP-binding protein n=1 Tax=Caballeronia sp. GAWG1-1 TaxID=2921742 RepID=UPI002027EE1F|nr:AMP-binding protein [Caballeronia sp. GAWG1-1]